MQLANPLQRWQELEHEQQHVLPTVTEAAWREIKAQKGVISYIYGCFFFLAFKNKMRR